MIFNKRSIPDGVHAFLSPSKGAWLNYDDDKMDRVFATAMAAQRGTEMHELAKNLIRLGVRLPDAPNTINMYVNDAIGFRMTPEQPLIYSENCFGTADTIAFRANKLRISDLKTGITPASFKQLEIYAALFCLEYRFKPFEIEMELRIYQNDDVKLHVPDPGDIFGITQKIVYLNKRLMMLKEEAAQ